MDVLKGLGLVVLCSVVMLSVDISVDGALVVSYWCPVVAVVRSVLMTSVDGRVDGSVVRSVVITSVDETIGFSDVPIVLATLVVGRIGVSVFSSVTG